MVTYAYDILLNFQKEFFDFFEWNKNDNITHIKKIPIIKVSNHDFYLFKNSLIQIETNFLYKIHNKTEKYNQKKKTIPYAFLINNGQETIAIKLNKNGINKYKSSLILDEEEEITTIAFNLKNEKLKYIILKNDIKPSFKTRKEKEIEKNIINSINKIYKNKEDEKLKFLYLDCFNKKENNIKKIYNELKKEVFNNTKNIKKINTFFNLNKNRG